MAYRSRESHRTDEIITKINRTGVMTARRATPLEVSNGYFIHCAVCSCVCSSCIGIKMRMYTSVSVTIIIVSIFLSTAITQTSRTKK